MRGSMSENQGELHGGGNTCLAFMGRKTLPAGERSGGRGGKRNPWGREGAGKPCVEYEVGKDGALGNGWCVFCSQHTVTSKRVCEQ